MDDSRKFMSIHAILDKASNTKDTADERKYRNKLASAKYRAKKLHQANLKSMSSKMSQLMANNAILQKELSKVTHENEILRSIIQTFKRDGSPMTPFDCGAKSLVTTP